MMQPNTSNLIQKRDTLLNAVKLPEKKKRQPSNFALLAAIVFANAVFGLLDIISGITVWSITGNPLYGVLTFMAGFVPLILHELLFTRAFASQTQKNIAVSGAVIALCSVVAVGVAAGVVNMRGTEDVSVQNAEIGVIVCLVLIAAVHAILCIIYFYIDDGIVANQVTAQRIAMSIHQQAQIQAGALILDTVKQSLAELDDLEKKHGSPDAIREILRQLGTDMNGDGIPDVMQKRAPMRAPMPAYGAETPQVPNPNGRNPQVQNQREDQ